MSPFYRSLILTLVLPLAAVGYVDSNASARPAPTNKTAKPTPKDNSNAPASRSHAPTSPPSSPQTSSDAATKIGTQDKTATSTSAIGTTVRVTLREKDNRPIRVLIDGIDQGACPLTLDLPPGTIEISGVLSDLMVPTQTLELKAGEEPREIILEAIEAKGRVEIRTSDGQGQIEIDGKEVGTGSFEGDLPIGEHVIQVRRDGFEPFGKTIRVGHGQVVVESVTLERTVSEMEKKSGSVSTLHDGIYGGFHLGFAVAPMGLRSSMETSCDNLHAASCTKPLPMGGMLEGFLGYALDPIGFELMLGFHGDYTNPVVHFDGNMETGGTYRIGAWPARDETFNIYRGGVVAAARVRSVFNFGLPRLYLAAGVGGAFKAIGAVREVKTTDGKDGHAKTISGIKTYWSPGVSLDLGVSLAISTSTHVSLGAWLWAETASNNARVEPELNRFIEYANVTNEYDKYAPLPSPGYDLANGGQVFVGPYIGLHFGP